MGSEMCIRDRNGGKYDYEEGKSVFHEVDFSVEGVFSKQCYGLI